MLFSAGCKSTYTVKSGDTLGNIATSQGTTTQALQAANPSITDPNKIFVGQQICIPGLTDTNLTQTRLNGQNSFAALSLSCAQNP